MAQPPQAIDALHRDHPPDSRQPHAHPVETQRDVARIHIVEGYTSLFAVTAEVQALQGGANTRPRIDVRRPQRAACCRCLGKRSVRGCRPSRARRHHPRCHMRAASVQRQAPVAAQSPLRLTEVRNQVGHQRCAMLIGCAAGRLDELQWRLEGRPPRRGGATQPPATPLVEALTQGPRPARSFLARRCPPHRPRRVCRWCGQRQRWREAIGARTAGRRCLVGRETRRGRVACVSCRSLPLPPQRRLRSLAPLSPAIRAQHTRSPAGRRGRAAATGPSTPPTPVALTGAAT